MSEWFFEVGGTVKKCFSSSSTPKKAEEATIDLDMVSPNVRGIYLKHLMCAIVVDQPLPLERFLAYIGIVRSGSVGISKT